MPEDSDSWFCLRRDQGFYIVIIDIKHAISSQACFYVQKYNVLIADWDLYWYGIVRTGRVKSLWTFLVHIWKWCKACELLSLNPYWSLLFTWGLSLMAHPLLMRLLNWSRWSSINYVTVLWRGGQWFVTIVLRP